MHLGFKRLTQCYDAGTSVLCGKVPAYLPLFWMVATPSIQRFILASPSRGSNWLFYNR